MSEWPNRTIRTINGETVGFKYRNKKQSNESLKPKLFSLVSALDITRLSRHSPHPNHHSTTLIAATHPPYITQYSLLSQCSYTVTPSTCPSTGWHIRTPHPFHFTVCNSKYYVIYVKKRDNLCCINEGYQKNCCTLKVYQRALWIPDIYFDHMSKSRDIQYIQKEFVNE